MSNYDQLFSLSATNPAADSIATFLNQVLSGGFVRLVKNRHFSSFQNTLSHLASIKGPATAELKVLLDRINRPLVDLNDAWSRIRGGPDTPAQEARVSAIDKKIDSLTNEAEVWLFDDANVERFCGEVLAALPRARTADQVAESLLESCPA